MSTTSPPYLHWNYFLALESDFLKVSRYIEIAEKNYQTYSLELAHLLFACSSEVEVSLKGICKKYAPHENPHNIDGCRKIIMSKGQQFADRKVLMPRFSISEISPFENWKDDENPVWWHAYNKVKHQRDKYYTEANLKNSIEALAGLFISVLHLYKEAAKEMLLSPNPVVVFPGDSYNAGADPVYGIWGYCL